MACWFVRGCSSCSTSSLLYYVQVGDKRASPRLVVCVRPGSYLNCISSAHHSIGVFHLGYSCALCYHSLTFGVISEAVTQTAGVDLAVLHLVRRVRTRVSPSACPSQLIDGEFILMSCGWCYSYICLLLAMKWALRLAPQAVRSGRRVEAATQTPVRDGGRADHSL